MDIYDFKSHLAFELGKLTNNSDKREFFLNQISELLFCCGEVNGYIHGLHFEDEIDNYEVKIDGFYFDEDEKKLIVLVIPELEIESYYSDLLNQQEVTEYINKAKNFLKIVGKIVSDYETHIADFASEYAMKYSREAKTIAIYLVTDKCLDRSVKVFTVSTANGKRIEAHVWDLMRLSQICLKTEKHDNFIIGKDELSEGKGLPCVIGCQTDVYTAYVGNIDGISLARLYYKYGERLLESNVRSFLQSTGKVNSGIAKTILECPDMFFAYNNGITATVSSVEIENTGEFNYIKSLRNMQIVNGGQTTAAMCMAYKNCKCNNIEENLKKIKIPIKICVINDNNNINNIVKDISYFANSQNRINADDLASNDAFHVRMKYFSERVLTKPINDCQFGTFWFYEQYAGQYKQATYKASGAEKRSFDMQNPKSQKLTKIEIAKYVNILQQKPYIANAGGQKSFKVFSEMINMQWDFDNTVFDERYYKKIVAAAILYRAADDIIREMYTSYKANIVAYTISKIIYEIEEKYRNKDIDYNEIWIQQELSVEWKEQIRKLAPVIHDFLTDIDRPVENVTEWAKKEECWKRAKELPIRFVKGFVKSLVNK